MTADQLTERLIELRRKYRLEVEDAKRREGRARVLFEELYGLGAGKLTLESWRDTKPIGEHRDEYVRNLQQHLRRQFYEDAHNLLKEWIGVS